MKEITLPIHAISFERALDTLLCRSQLQLVSAIGELQKTQEGQRAMQAFLLITIRQSKELSATDWKALTTLCLAAAHNAKEPLF